MCRSHIAGTMLSMPYFLLHLAWSPNRPPQRIPWRSGLEECRKVSIELVLVRVGDAVAEDNGLARAPVFIIDLCAVRGRDGAHELISLAVRLREVDITTVTLTATMAAASGAVAIMPAPLIRAVQRDGTACAAGVCLGIVSCLPSV
jgi:hypothetical protein